LALKLSGFFSYGVYWQVCTGELQILCCRRFAVENYGFTSGRLGSEALRLFQLWGLLGVVMAPKVVCEKFNDYASTVSPCLTMGGAEALFSDGRPVMLKPNLINASPHPVTTPRPFVRP
jgi:hypothetical protein